MFGFISICLVGSFVWRWTCQFFCIPWPHWLAFMLENPYMKVVSPSRKLVDRLHLRPGMVVIDFGCGSGRLSLPIAQGVAPDGLLIGLDLQAKMLEKAEARLAKWGCRNSKFYRIDLQQGSCISLPPAQRAVLTTVLGEVPNPAQLVQLVFKSLDSGGLFSVTEVLPDPCYQSRKRVIALCEATGFQLVEEFIENLSYTLNFMKPSIRSLQDKAKII